MAVVFSMAKCIVCYFHYCSKRKRKSDFITFRSGRLCLQKNSSDKYRQFTWHQALLTVQEAVKVGSEITIYIYIYIYICVCVCVCVHLPTTSFL